MPLVSNKKHFLSGDVPTASELNAPYDSLASQSGQIDSQNTATGWMTYKHYEAGDTGAPVFNQMFQYNNPTQTETFYNNTTYQTISQGGNPAQITLNITPIAGELIRFSASGMVGDHTVAIDYDYAGLPGGNFGKPNFYAFRLLLNYSDSGVPGTLNLGEWGYSFTTKKDGTLTSTITPTISGPINWQAFAFSTVYRHSVSSRLLLSVELQCKVFDNTNSLSIERHQLYAIRGKR